MKYLALLTAIFSLFSFASFAKTSDNEFFFKPSLSVEYRAPVISSGGTNSDFKTSHASFAKTSDNEFFFKPSLSVEYSAPVISSGGINSDFKTSHNIFLVNCATGFNFRMQKYSGKLAPLDSHCATIRIGYRKAF